MFIRKNASAEIAETMANNLIDGAMGKYNEVQNKFEAAVKHISEASEIFDNIDLHKEAEETVKLLEIVAKIKHRSDPATKNLSSKKMIENLKHKGWVFNADDFNNSSDHPEGCDCSMCEDIDSNYIDFEKGDLQLDDKMKQKLHLIEKSNKCMQVALQLMHNGEMAKGDEYLDKSNELYNQYLMLSHEDALVVDDNYIDFEAGNLELDEITKRKIRALTLANKFVQHSLDALRAGDEVGADRAVRKSFEAEEEYFRL